MTFIAQSPYLGAVDLTQVDLVAPGPANLVGTAGSGRWPQLGDIVTGYDTTLGGGEFIYLSVPTSTAIPAGTIVAWDGNYSVSAAPNTLGGSGAACAVAHTAIASNADNVQYAWFQIQGKVATLKTAVTVPAASRIFLSGTAGRLYLTVSGAKQIVGARTANTASVTSTTSTVLVMLNRPHINGAVT